MNMHVHLNEITARRLMQCAPLGTRFEFRSVRWDTCMICGVPVIYTCVHYMRTGVDPRCRG